MIHKKELVIQKLLVNNVNMFLCVCLYMLHVLSLSNPATVGGVSMVGGVYPWSDTVVESFGLLLLEPLN